MKNDRPTHRAAPPEAIRLPVRPHVWSFAMRCDGASVASQYPVENTMLEHQDYTLGVNAVVMEEAGNRIFYYATAASLNLDAPKARSELRGDMLRQCIAHISAAGLATPRKETNAKRGKGKPQKPALERAVDRALAAAQWVAGEYHAALRQIMVRQNDRAVDAVAKALRDHMTQRPVNDPLRKVSTLEGVERVRDTMRKRAAADRAKEEKAEGITAETKAADRALSTMRDAMVDAAILCHMPAADMLAMAADMLDKAGAPHLAIAVRKELAERPPAE